MHYTWYLDKCRIEKIAINFCFCFCCNIITDTLVEVFTILKEILTEKNLLFFAISVLCRHGQARAEQRVRQWQTVTLMIIGQHSPTTPPAASHHGRHRLMCQEPKIPCHVALQCIVNCSIVSKTSQDFQERYSNNNMEMSPSQAQYWQRIKA